MKLLIFLLAVLAGFTNSRAQVVEQDVVYDFSASASDTMGSDIQLVYADSNIIVVAGNVCNRDKEVIHAFTAGFNYGGALLWQRHLPQGTILNLNSPRAEYRSASGNSNLKKDGLGRYVLGGSRRDTMVRPGYTIAQPFLYFFDTAGDSLLYKEYTDPLRSTYITALNIDHDGNVIVAGTRDSEGYTFSDEPNPIFCPIDNYIWLAKFDMDGTITNQWETPGSIPGFELFPGLPISVTNIFRSLDLSRYDVFYMYPLSPLMFVMSVDAGLEPDDDDDRMYLELFAGGTTTARGDSYYPNFAALQMPDSNGQYFFAGSSMVENLADVGFGLWFGSVAPAEWRVYNDTALLVDERFIPDGIGFPRLDGGLSMALAKNNDVLIQKIGVSPGVDQWGPGIFRMDKAANIRWQMLHQRIPMEGFGIRQMVNSTSVAPDGRIVMAGSIAADTLHSGVFDTVGSISWLFILNDSAHDAITSTKNIIPEVNIGIYPNPATDYVTVTLSSSKALKPSELMLTLTDVAGKVLTEQPLHKLTERIDFNGYAAGLYFVNVYQNGRAVATAKVVMR